MCHVRMTGNNGHKGSPSLLLSSSLPSEAAHAISQSPLLKLLRGKQSGSGQKGSSDVRALFFLPGTLHALAHDLCSLVCAPVAPLLVDQTGTGNVLES